MAQISLIVFSLSRALPQIGVPAGLYAVGIEIGNIALATTYWPGEAISQAAEEARLNVTFQDQQIFDLVCRGITTREVLLRLTNVKIIK